MANNPGASRSFFGLNFAAAGASLLHSTRPLKDRRSVKRAIHPIAIGVGLIGSGNITQTHARAVRAIPGVELAAISRTNVANVARLCQRYGGTAYENFEDLRRLDFVILRSRSGHGIAAEHHGFDVWSEKPVDISSHRADALIRAAEPSGLNLGVIFQDRLKPGLRQLRGSIPKAGAGQDDAGGRAREVVPAPEILRRFAMTRDLCA